LRLHAISWNIIYAKRSAFFEIAQALILSCLQSRLTETFYKCIKNHVSIIIPDRNLSNWTGWHFPGRAFSGDPFLQSKQ